MLKLNHYSNMIFLGDKMKKKEIQTEKPVLVKKRKKWFQVLKNIMKIKYKKTQFIYLGERRYYFK